MSNALRMFIRESLTNEAAGQITWMRQAGAKYGGKPTGPAKSNFVTDSFKTLFPNTSAKSAWSALTARRKVKSGAAAAAKSKTSRITARGASYWATFAGLITALGFGLSSNDTGVDEKLGNFYSDLEDIRLSNLERIQKGYQTPEVLSISDSSDVDSLIAKMSENYTRKTNAILNSSKLDDFFNKTELSDSYRNMQSSISMLIDQNAANGDKEELSKFVFAYLLSDSTAEMLSALSNDVDLIQGSKGGLDSGQNSKIEEIMRSIARIENDPEYKASLELMKTITE